MSTLKIKRVRVGDLDVATRAQLYQLAHEKNSRFKSWLDRGKCLRSAAYLAHLDGELVGWGWMVNPRIKHLGIFVRPDLRRRGIGTAIVKRCLKDFKMIRVLIEGEEPLAFFSSFPWSGKYTWLFAELSRNQVLNLQVCEKPAGRKELTLAP